MSKTTFYFTPVVKAKLDKLIQEGGYKGQTEFLSEQIRKKYEEVFGPESEELKETQAAAVEAEKGKQVAPVSYGKLLRAAGKLGPSGQKLKTPPRKTRSTAPPAAATPPPPPIDPPERIPE